YIQLSRRRKIGISRPFLDGELIKRHMALLLAESASEFAPPLLHRLAGPCINEIEGHARKDLRRQAESGERLSGRMLAPQRLEIGVIECLYADRDAVDAGRAIAGKIPRFDAGRVGFERRFGIG